MVLFFSLMKAIRLLELEAGQMFYFLLHHKSSMHGFLLAAGLVRSLHGLKAGDPCIA
jgi:hypothetical protein